MRLGELQRPLVGLDELVDQDAEEPVASGAGEVGRLAAADRSHGRVARLVHLDAYVPREVDSCWSLAGERYRLAFVAGATATGYSVRPPPGGDPRRRPHPLASLLQAVRLTGAQAHVPRREFIHCSGWGASPSRELRARLEVDRGWRVSELPTGHNAMREAPGAVAALLLASWRAATPPATPPATSAPVTPAPRPRPGCDRGPTSGRMGAWPTSWTTSRQPPPTGG